MVAPEAVTARVRRQHPDRLSTAGASRPEAHAIRRTAESLEILDPCSQYLIRPALGVAVWRAGGAQSRVH